MNSSTAFCPEGLCEHSPHRWGMIRKTLGGRVYECERCNLSVVGNTDPSDDLRAKLELHGEKFELALLGVREFSAQVAGLVRVYYARPIDERGAKFVSENLGGGQTGRVELPGERGRREFFGPTDLCEGYAEAHGLAGAIFLFAVRVDSGFEADIIH